MTLFFSSKKNSLHGFLGAALSTQAIPDRHDLRDIVISFGTLYLRQLCQAVMTIHEKDRNVSFFTKTSFAIFISPSLGLFPYWQLMEDIFWY